MPRWMAIAASSPAMTEQMSTMRALLHRLAVRILATTSTSGVILDDTPGLPSCIFRFR